MTIETPVSSAQFDTWVIEHPDESYELINGRIALVVSNSPASRIAFKIGGFLFVYLQDHPIGEATGADGGYQIGNERYISGVAFIRTERQVPDASGGYYPVAPDLAVEVISNPQNTQEMRDLRVKIGYYTAAGTVVWVVDPDAQAIEVYQSGQPTQVYTRMDTLSGGNLLPDFTLTVADVFPTDTQS